MMQTGGHGGLIGGGGLSVRARAIAEARRALSEGDAKRASRALEPLMKRAKADPEALFLAGVCAERRRKITLAADLARRSLALLEHPDAQLLLARCERVRGNTDACVSLCDAVLSRHPDSLPARVVKGGALEEAGRFDEARAVIEPLIEGGIDEPAVRFEWAKLLVQAKEYGEAIALIDALLERADNDELRRAALHLRAKACDRMGDYDGAFASAARANEIGKLEFSPELYEQQVSVLIENWSREAMERFPISDCDSEIPVFVAGMPRSGTSLIDQIIDAHPRAAGVGELATIERFAIELAAAWDPDAEPPACFGRYTPQRWTRAARAYVREITRQAPDAERIVNKALGNNKLVGLIARLFPRTRIIHAIRDPRDVAISCFMGGFNNNLHPWTTQIDWAARAWEQSMRMMEHWKRSLDVPILDVHYERLVRDPDTEFPRIIEFLGLEWDDACREFHKSRRTVRTLSYDQVNRPLYTSSAGRHRNYARHIAGVSFPVYDAGC